MSAPLADRMRPKTLDDLAGQKHLIGPGMALGRIIQSGVIPNMIFYGPSGIGKTTLAGIIARQTNKKFYKLNGTNASTADIKSIIGDIDSLEAANGILLYLDEIQYLNKKQQQSLLEFIENGSITLIASTTENPYFYIYNAILSRCTVFEFKPLDAQDVKAVVKRAFDYLSREQSITVDAGDDIIQYIASSCGGDVRKAINAAELCVLSAQRTGDTVKISIDDAKQVTQKSSMRYDRDGDMHYDILSAFQKSMRGSDPDAAIHYLARLIKAGDLTSICRRLMVCACEDMGLAYPTGIAVVKACVDAALQVGLPEARIPLADAVILVCTAPKSNSGVNAIDAAIADIEKGDYGDIPAFLRDVHYSGAQKLGHGQGYKYPHSFENSWIEQQYLPDNIKDRKYYVYGKNRTEQTAERYWEGIKGKKNDR